MWLIRAYLQKWKFILMMVGGIIPPAIMAPPLGRYLGKVWGMDDQLIIGAFFFIFLASEVYAYDRLQTWWYFRKLRQ
jgi:hypothetical protein